MTPSMGLFLRVGCVSLCVGVSQLGLAAPGAQVGVPSRVAAVMAAKLNDGPSAGPDARTITDRAKKQAAREHKEILVKFSGSWCGPCHLWDAVLADPPVKAIVDPRFVIVDLDAAENAGDTKHQETPGAQAYMASLGTRGSVFPLSHF